ncbi:LamG-like jellyroll fold domain-containing protein [Streptomyces fungicidicus]|uniref:LamG-like jellyroll fold domain-containing protein n=1 Tax=Streptomyces fungicidicus TaxID=68203 RepID=UPI003D74EA43
MVLTLPATTAYATTARPGGPPSEHANDRARSAVAQAAQHQQGSVGADDTAPLPPRITLAAPYTECLADDCRKAGGPGVAAKFTFAPNEADTDIVSYRYILSSQPTWSSVTGETATVTYVPQQSGHYRLEVQAVDGTGWPGASTVLDFMVASGQADIGRWHFDETSGAALDSGTAAGAARHHAVLTGGATRDDRGRRGERTHDSVGAPLPAPATDRGLALDGSSGFAATSGPVVDTRESYTVSAWVRPDTLGGNDRAVLAQDGGFGLSYEAAQGTWTLRPALPVGTDHRTVVAEQPATPKVWTHLTAVYDAPADEARLYVNGRLQATGPTTGTGAADGPLQFGRALSDGSPTEYTDYFDGSIDEVAVWQRALTDTEIAGEARMTLDGARNAVELVADWSAEGATGATLTDTSSGYDARLTLSGGATLDGETLVLDGVDGTATADGPLVDGTGSFTVSTEVTLEGAAVSTWDVGRVGQVVSQRAADGSTWGLWYEATGMETVLDPDTFEEKLIPVGLWRFGRMNADGTYVAAASEEAARTDEPVRLTGVYDAQEGTIELYIGEVRNGAALSVANAPGRGDFTVGAARDGDTLVHHLPARIADIRVWAGAMASSQQLSEVIGD